MYVTIRKYAGKGAVIDKLLPPVRDGLVPLLRQAPGFKGYYAFASEDGHVVTVAIFDDREAATRANEQVRGWVASNLGELLPNLPEVLAGEALLHDVSKLKDDDAEMFAVIRRYPDTAPEEKAMRVLREHIYPMLTASPGFRGHYSLSVEQDGSRRAVAVSLFDARERAMVAQETAAGMMRTHGLTGSAPSVLAGRLVLAASAEG